MYIVFYFGCSISLHLRPYKNKILKMNMTEPNLRMFDLYYTYILLHDVLFDFQVRDYCLGPSFPTLKNVTLMKGAPEEPGKVPEVCMYAVYSYMTTTDVWAKLELITSYPLCGLCCVHY